MGSSAFDPVSVADIRSTKSKMDLSGLTADVLSVGDVIRYDPATDKYLRAQANSEANANFIGVIESINANDFVVVYSGEISLPDSVMSLVSGYTGSQIFYLSATNPGKLSATPPTNPGHVIKPVVITTGTVEDTYGNIDGIVVNSYNAPIGGDSTVDLSDIQPVGSVMAFAGNTGQIPTGWDICDGGFLSISTYGDLYAALNSGKIYGFIESLTLDRVDNSGSGFLTTANLIGSKFYVTKNGNNDGVECTILSGTVATTGNQVTGVTVFVNPIYVAGAAEGNYHETELVTNDLGRFIDPNGSSIDAIYKVTNPTKTQFKKPDLRARFLLGSSRGYTGLQNTAFGTYTIGNAGGEEQHVLTESELAVHGHDSTFISTLTGTPNVSYNLQVNSAGSHTHPNIWLRNTDLNLGGPDQVYANVPTLGGGNNPPLPDSGSHSHTITGTINFGIGSLSPNVEGTIENAGANSPHNNVPQHVVVYWIIKTRKDSYAKILRIGPSGGGAVIARNTPKRWARTTSGAGCTVDLAYGNWSVARIGLGNYEFTHDLLTEFGNTGATAYIVEVTVSKSSPSFSEMLIANPYNYGGTTFGVQVYNVIGATMSDNFRHLNITVYGGGTF